MFYVRFEGEFPSSNWYTRDGKLNDYLEHSSLFWDVPVEPPRPKRKVKREGWVNVYPDTCITGAKTGEIIHADKILAEGGADKKVVHTTVKICWEEWG
jgi:hypothetical protein